MFLQPDQYAATPVTDLLSAASRGWIGLDHRFLRAILDRFEEAVPDLVKFGLQDEEDADFLAPELVALFRYRPCAEALPFLVECVRRDAAEVPDELVEAFCRLGDAAVGPLLDLYGELGPERGEEVAFVLAALHSPDPRVLELLKARSALCPDEGPFLLDMHNEPPGSLDPYDIWSDFPERAGPSFDLMSLSERIQFLESPSPEHRADAVANLHIAADDVELRNRVFELAQHDPDAAVRGGCWAALREAHADEEIHPAMLARLQDQQAPPVERCGCLSGLAWEPDDPLVRPYFLEFYQTPETRAGALEAMWRSMDPEFAPYFSRHLDDPDLVIRRPAIMGVGYLRLHAETGRLEKYFYDEELRPDALYAYALAAPGKVSALHARQVMKKIEELAGGLSQPEVELVETALDDLLQMHGRKPLFTPPQPH